MFKKTAIILAAMALSVGAASAAVVNECQSGKYSTGLTLVCGDKTFGDFRIGGDLSEDDLGKVDISTFMINGVIGLNFGGNFFADTASGNNDFQIFYSVMTDGNWLISEIGQAFTPSFFGAGGTIAIGESVRVGSFAGPTVAQSNLSWVINTNCFAAGNDCEDPAVEGDQLILLDPNAPHDPKGQLKVYVSKDIQIRPFSCRTEDNCYNGVGATIITQTFTQIPNGDIPPVPEPATMLLFSTALLGLGFMRRKKS